MVDWMTRGRPSGRPAVLAHRGGAALGEPNSREVLARAKEAGADAVEMDLQETADGHLVLAHDSSVMAGGRWRWVRDMTVAELAAMTGSVVVSAGALLDECRRLGLGLYAEIKAAHRETVDAFVGHVAGREMVGRVCVGSFRADIVAAVGHHSPVPASILFHDLGADPVAYVQDLGCDFVHPCFDDHPGMVDLIDGPWAERVWAAGAGMVSWNSVDSALLARFAEAGFAAVCTDDPRLVDRPDRR